MLSDGSYRTLDEVADEFNIPRLSFPPSARRGSSPATVLGQRPFSTRIVGRASCSVIGPRSGCGKLCWLLPDRRPLGKWRAAAVCTLEEMQT